MRENEAGCSIPRCCFVFWISISHHKCHNLSVSDPFCLFPFLFLFSHTFLLSVGSFLYFSRNTRPSLPLGTRCQATTFLHLFLSFLGNFCLFIALLPPDAARTMLCHDTNNKPLTNARFYISFPACFGEVLDGPPIYRRRGELPASTYSQTRNLSLREVKFDYRKGKYNC